MKVVRLIRTQKTIDAYKKFIKSGFVGCGMCREKNVKEFKYWRIIKARFPLDKISRIDHLIMPKRHVSYKELKTQEKKEYEIIKQNYLAEKYESLFESMPKAQSIPSHHHIHLIVWKKN